MNYYMRKNYNYLNEFVLVCGLDAPCNNLTFYLSSQKLFQKIYFINIYIITCNTCSFLQD